MAVRAFDVAGTVAVAGWLAVTGFFIYRNECGGTEARRALDSSELRMEEGESWMLLRRQGDEIGYLHRTHTRLEEGWLVEYDMLVLLDMLDQQIPIDTTVKATLDEEGYVSNAHAEIDLAGRHFEARGQIDGHTATLILEPEGREPIHRTLSFDQRPRLAANSVHQLLARDNLAPGDTFEETYFDPTSMSRESIVMRYKGREQVDVFDRSTEAHFIRQEIAGRELDVYVDDRGRILVQEFPMKIVGARVRSELGKTRASKLQNDADTLHEKIAAGDSKLGQGLEMALDLLESGGGAQLVPGLGMGAASPSSDSRDAGPPRPDGSRRPDASQP